MFNRFLILSALALVLATGVQCKRKGESMQTPSAPNPVVLVETSSGIIKIELFADKAPISAKNFLQYVDEKFYDGTVFHRVKSDFMIQGGGFTPDLREKITRQQIKNEAGNGLKNARGTLAMARRSDPDSASAQFFINVVDNDFLNHRDDSQPGFGYAVFGKVIEGMDVVDKIKGVQTGTVGQYEMVPVTPVIIKSARRQEAK